MKTKVAKLEMITPALRRTGMIVDMLRPRRATFYLKNYSVYEHSSWYQSCIDFYVFIQPISLVSKYPSYHDFLSLPLLATARISSSRLDFRQTNRKKKVVKLLIIITTFLPIF